MKRVMFAGAVLVLAAGIAPAAALIDDFTQPTGTNTIFNVAPAVVGTYTATQGPGLVGVIGGQRDYELKITVGSLVSKTKVVQYADGTLNFVSDANGPFVLSTLELIYGLGGALNANLSADQDLVLQVLFADLGGGALITLIDGASNSATVTVPIPAVALSESVSIPLTGFVGVDLSDIAMIRVKFVGPAAWDIVLASIYTTPQPTPPPPPCYQGETAWAAGNRYVQRGNWAMYVPYAGLPKTVDIIAGGGNGHGVVVGTATFSAPVNGAVTITIALTGGVVFGDADDDGNLLPTEEALKVQDYAGVPPSRNPSPGRFAWKASPAAGSTGCVITVPANNYYGVQMEVALPCEP